jgi:hypothetical protein
LIEQCSCPANILQQAQIKVDLCGLVNDTLLVKVVGTVWMVGVNIYPKENDLPLLVAPTNICLLGCLDGGVNVDVDERGRAGPTTNLLQFATF